MPDPTPASIGHLCDALRSGDLGTYTGGRWVELDPGAASLRIDPGGMTIACRDLDPDCRRVWERLAPAWAQPALDGVAVSPPTTTQPEATADGQGELWNTR